MKILVSAIACNPYQGSESHFGWSAVQCLAQEHQVHVITSGRNQPDLEKAAAAGLIPPNVHFAYAGKIKPWHPSRFLARLQSWKEYILFTEDSLNVAKELHRKEKFDLVQHITYTTPRVGSPMWQLGIPFVLGPICGNETFPFRIFPVLSPIGAAFELARKSSNVFCRLSPGVRQSIRRADHIFAVTMEAKQLVTALRGSDEGVSQLSPGFYSAEKMDAFSRFVPGKNVNGLLRLYAAGNLGGQKCIALAFQALALVKKRGVNFRYHLGASGPEIPHLKKLAARLDLTKEVLFGSSMSRQDYQQELGDTHIYLLPSMRETVGLTMMEAMLAGAVPIVADNGGPRLTVTGDCGYKIPVSTPGQMAEEIADIIVKIDADRTIIAEKGKLASQRIVTHFSDEHYRQTINAVYQSLASRGKRTDDFPDKR